MLREVARRERWAVSLWLVVLVVVSAHTLLSVRSHSVYHIFADAGRRWAAGESLYDPDAAEPYRYSPVVSACLAPFGLIPDGVGGVLWRCLGAAVLLVGLLQASRGVFGIEAHHRGLFLLLVLPLAVGNLHNGQSNVLLLGLLLLAVTGAVRQRWSLAGLCCALACWLKVYPVALALLLLLIRPRRFAPWFILFLAVGFLLPFALQGPEYVTEQYASWVQDLGEKDRHLFSRDQWYRDFRALCAVCGIPMSRLAYQGLQLLTAAGIAILTWGRLRGGQAGSLPHGERLVFNLACCWMTLFGPATESATYILLAPTLAWLVLRDDTESAVVRSLSRASYGIMLASHVAVWFPFGKEVQMWEVRPLAALLLLAAILWNEARGSCVSPSPRCAKV